jgi:hypothetical protein
MRLLGRVDTGDTEEIGDLCEGLTVTCMESAKGHYAITTAAYQIADRQ